MEEIEVLTKCSKKDWETFKFIETQLGVLDRKASSIVQLDALLLGITLCLINFAPTKTIIFLGAFFVLISALLCLKVIWIKWASKILAECKNGKKGLKKLTEFRDKKTRWLSLSIICLSTGFVFYFITLLSSILQVF